LLVERPGAGDGASPGTKFDVVRLTAYSEELWYANGSSSNPTSPPSDNPIPLVVANLTVDSARNLSTQYSSSVTEVAVQSGWTDVGTLLDTPVTQLTALPAEVTLARRPAAAAAVATPALLEDANGNGAAVTATPTAGTSDVALSPPAAAILQPPLRLLWDLVTVTRGASVLDEPLGVGDARQAGQDFALFKFPVTYFADGIPGAGTPPSRSGDGYSSTIELVVDGVRWTEVPTLFGRGATERVFCTYEDEGGKTHVVTGDGVNGRRLRTGASVSASYRTGSGSAVPASGAISQLLSTVPNLTAVRNPVPAGGGDDPDPPDQLRAYAPRSVLTFGRAVSGDDYAAVAALAPGVTRAAAQWSWDPDEQRAMVRVYVGDDSAAVDSARTALRQESDPNRPLVVLPAVARKTWLGLTLELDPAFVADDVVAAVRSSLLDGLFAPGTLEIGEILYRSQIEAACDLPGVLAVHNLRMVYRRSSGYWITKIRGPRFSPGEDGYFDLAGERLLVEAVSA
jgi:predicted phage baseplate assembly protein